MRKRGDDVIQLAVHFLETICREFGREVPSLTNAQANALMRYSWPGNVRELKNVIERAVILSPGEHLRLDLSFQDGGESDEVSVVSDEMYPERNFVTEQEMKQHQKDNLRNALEFAGWRISGKEGAAELLGLRPTTLTDRMRALGIQKP